jgi:hypothetical protein
MFIFSSSLEHASHDVLRQEAGRSLGELQLRAVSRRQGKRDGRGGGGWRGPHRRRQLEAGRSSLVENGAGARLITIPRSSGDVQDAFDSGRTCRRGGSSGGTAPWGAEARPGAARGARPRGSAVPASSGDGEWRLRLCRVVECGEGGGATEECSLAVDSDAASLLAGAMARDSRRREEEE